MGSKQMAHEGNLDTLVRESLRHKIMSGEMEGGYHLSELKISKDYNVSRTPVREALCALAADGLVEMVPHRGAFVTHSNAQTKTDQLRAYGLFCGLSAKLAAENANIEMLMDLETAFSFAQGEATIAPDVYQNAVETALEMMEKTAGSAIVSEALGMVSRRTSTSDIWATITSSQQGEFNNQFNLLMAAMKRKKPDSAEKTMRQIAAMATTAYMGSRKSATAADAVTGAMAKQFAKENVATVN